LEEAEDKEDVVFETEIEDEGEGIEKERLKSLFKVFENIRNQYGGQKKFSHKKNLE